MNASEILALENECIAALTGAGSSSQLEALRVQFLGKAGSITRLVKSVSSVPPEQRKEYGRLVNELKRRVEEQLEARKEQLEASEETERLQSEWIDITLPKKTGIPFHSVGSLHPLTQVQRELEQIFRGLGFTVVDGPEVEKEWYNFDALNIPDTHPARDMQDTFWTTTGDVLRTHTSAMQIRALERLKPPLRIVAPGRVFRCERIDASHEHTFYQMEGMLVDRKVSVSQLLYFMRTLLREILGFDPKIRLRPGYFPFVEPGFELDIWFKNRWMELLPCGLVHPRVFELCGHDPKQWQGFAFGLGLSRLVMSRYEIEDIRHLQGCDLRFLRQFS